MPTDMAQDLDVPDSRQPWLGGLAGMSAALVEQPVISPVELTGPR
jgi:hypothetical protein